MWVATRLALLASSLTPLYSVLCIVCHIISCSLQHIFRYEYGGWYVRTMYIYTFSYVCSIPHLQKNLHFCLSFPQLIIQQCISTMYPRKNAIAGLIFNVILYQIYHAWYLKEIHFMLKMAVAPALFHPFCFLYIHIYQAWDAEYKHPNLQYAWNPGPYHNIRNVSKLQATTRTACTYVHTPVSGPNSSRVEYTAALQWSIMEGCLSLPAFLIWQWRQLCCAT